MQQPPSLTAAASRPSPIRVGIDVSTLATSHRRRGIGTYVSNLVRGLTVVAQTSDDIEVVPIGPPEAIDALALSERSSGKHAGRRVGRLAAFRYSAADLPRLARDLDLSVFHFPYVPTHVSDAFVPAWSSRSCCPLVVTVHDLIPARYPGSIFRNPTGLIGYLFNLSRVRSACHLITNSHFTGADVAAFLGLPPTRFTTVHLGIASTFTEVAGAALGGLRAAGVGPRSYVVCVGHLSRAKNLVSLLEAFAILRSERLYGGRLVLVATHEAARSRDLARCLARLNLTDDDVKIVGNLEEADLAGLYANAAAAVVPSVLEGFGLPLLEAMACGCPVISSRTSSLPEVGGDAPVYVDPFDARSIATQLSLILGDEGIRAAMRQRGLARARGFTWGDAARRTVAVYKTVARARRLAVT